MEKFILSFCLSILFLGQGFAQDSTFIRSKRDELTLKLITVEKYSRVYLRDQIENVNYRYHPNETANIGFGLNYKWIGVNLAFNPAPNRKVDEFGRTRKLDLKINSYGAALGFDIQLMNYRGYYLENPHVVEPGRAEDDYVIRPDMNTFNLGFNVYYVVNNEEFSMRASYIQTEIQRKSAGSLIGGFFGSIYGMSSDLSLTNITDNSILYPNSPFVQGGAFITTGIMLGYIHTFVLKEHFYFTLGATPGLGLQVSSVNLLFSEDITRLRLAGKAHLRAGLGYNADRFFAGLSAISDNQRLINTNDIRISSEIGEIRFFLGTRF